jgi:hypothetical protein
MASALAEAIRKYGPSVNAIAAGYRNPVTGGHLSGTALLAKLIQGESGGSASAVSSAGARGWTQFMPDTRQSFIKAYGIDPWRSPDEAVHAAALHLRGALGHGKGLEGYNPGGGQGYVNYILGQRVGAQGGTRGGGSSSGGGGAAVTGGGSMQPAPPEVGQVNLSALLAATSQKPQPVPASPLPDPQFSSRANLKLPATYQAPSTGGVPEQSNGLDQALAILAASPPPTGLPPTGDTSAAGSAAQAGSYASPRGRMGDVRVSSGANRAGVGLTPGILRVVREVAGVAGQPLTIGTGTNHSQMTVNGNVSDHWSGNAADIPARGKTLVQLGQDALIAAGMDPKKARQQTGGLFNLPYGRHRRIQVIFNTHEGGDHTNHLHVGVSPVR